MGKGCGVKSTWLPLDATVELLVHNLESGYTTLAKDLTLCADIEGLLEQQEYNQRLGGLETQDGSYSHSRYVKSLCPRLTCRFRR